MGKTTFKAVLLFSFVFSLNLHAANEPYPKGPHLDVTPGDVCSLSGRLRYPEKVQYCERNVDTELKYEIIRYYDRTFGYRIGTMDRQKFKIDHLIPLCMGGSNDRKNLWPQHVSIYMITDPLEPLLCEKMAAGRLKQKLAIEMIKKVKIDLSKASEVLREAKAL
jgi:hypothetical protein